jgi:EmrB/QacA subfamily drug resistance transporter
MHARRWWALAVLCLSLLVIGIDNTVLNVALPALVRDLHASTSQLQWIVDGYTLVFAGLLLSAGSLGDRFGRKGALSIGLALFGLGSALSAFASSANVLIFTRAFMGIGAALIMPATLSLLTNIFADPVERARAIGVWAAVAGGGSAIGPVLGGFLLQHFWWGSVFLVNVPVALVALIVGRFLLPSSRDPSAPRLDPIGALASIAGLVALLWSIIEAPTNGWGDPRVLVGFGMGAVLLVAFVWWELQCDHPMLDVRFFENPRFSAASSALAMVFFAMMGASFLITQYLQTVLGFSALEAGLRMLPMAVLLLCVAPVSPRLVERFGTKAVAGTGLLLGTVGLVFLSRVPVADGYPHLLVALIIISSGMGLVMAPATESIMGSLPPTKAGVGSAMNDTTRQMGGALGVAVLGSVLASAYRPAVSSRLDALRVPASTVANARDSVGGAIAAASNLPASVRVAVGDAARHAFVHAFSSAVIVGAIVMAVAAAVVLTFLPARARDAIDARRGPAAARHEALEGLAAVEFAEGFGAAEQIEQTG